ncbi:hypothetical protein KY343_04355 [Candidatus Woesearchaeota archaeon]|nr:hypothetical protein [Candidatus Woesearchaeota archaeon]
MSNKRYTSNQSLIHFRDERKGKAGILEFAVGKLDDIKEISREYGPVSSPFVMLYFKVKENDNHGLAKVVIPKNHEDVSTGLVGYINEVKDELVDYMKQQNPGCEVRGAVTVHGTRDQVILNMMRRYVRLEEIVRYKMP